MAVVYSVSFLSSLSLSSFHLIARIGDFFSLAVAALVNAAKTRARLFSVVEKERTEKSRRETWSHGDVAVAGAGAASSAI